MALRELDPELQSKGSASDLVQETFLDAQRDFAQFAGATERELEGWLRQILRNNLVDFTRKYRATRKRQIDAELALAGPASSSDWSAKLVAEDSTPSALAVAKEQTEALEQALGKLPADYQEVIRLRIRGAQTFEEIGFAMSRSAEAVRKLFVRAIERLQEEFEAPP
jgi:RNA polymerase sigma-70 factor (ECF subfamily)